MKYIDDLLNRVTMYRLLVYSLSAYAALAVLMSALGKFSFSPAALVGSLAAVLAATYIADRTCSWLNKAPANSESWLITGLIIFLIVQPATTAAGFLALALAGVVGGVSKTLLTWHGKHVFNPAALAAGVVSVAALEPTTWWIGSSLFWPLTLVLGLAVVRKIRRFSLVIVFAAVYVALQLSIIAMHGQLDVAVAKSTLVASPLIFLGTIMLTEPATMPAREYHRLLFAALVAVLAVTGWKVGPVYIDPEIALLIGNVYAFAVSPKFRSRLRLTGINKVSGNIYDYAFRPDRGLAFLPGQYMEWTLPGVAYDSRGNRRTFTIASSPTEDELHLGVKFYKPSSAFKAALYKLKPGDYIYASELAGNFTVNWHGSEKLAFIAGGIGVTPFRSQIKYALDKGIKRDIVVVYAVSDARELAYQDLFREAAKIGVRYEPVVDGALTADALRQLVPDYAERTCYVSGPNRMVDATKAALKALGAKRVVTDHFSGY